MTCTEAAPDLDNGTSTAILTAAQAYSIQHTKDTVADATMTHHTVHTASHQYTAAHHVNALRTTVNHIHAHPIDYQNITHAKEGHLV